MVPVVLEMVRPAGSEGDTDQDTTVPPVEVGANALMDVPFVSVSEFWEYPMLGAISLTTMVTVAVSLPPVLLAVTV